MYFRCFGFRGELGFLNCDDVCMWVVNKQFELLEFVSESVHVDLQYDEISLTFTAGPVCLCGVSSPVVVLGLFVRLARCLISISIPHHLMLVADTVNAKLRDHLPILIRLQMKTPSNQTYVEPMLT